MLDITQRKGQINFSTATEIVHKKCMKCYGKNTQQLR